MTVIEGQFVPSGKSRFAIVAARFNAFITERLVAGAEDALRRHGVKDDHVTLVWVPGSWEIPIAAQRLAESGKYDAIIAVGCVIKGSTDHYDHVAGEASKGIAQVALATGVPVLNAVLATHNLEQAIERAGSKQGNKGFDVAVAAIELVDVLSKLPKAST